MSLYSYTLLTISNRFDSNKENGGKSFKDDDPSKWKGTDMMVNFAEWGAQCFRE